MGSPLYYVILGALLAVLVITLIYLIRKRKREEEQIKAYQEKMDKLRAERQAEEVKKQPNWRFWSEENQYTNYNEAEQQSKKWRYGKTYVDDDGYIPKYAAGDDMDRLNREKEYPSNDIPYLPIILAAIGLISVIAFVSTGKNDLVVKQPNMSQQITHPETTEKLSVELLSAEENPDRTKVYVTVRYKNESMNTCYDIVTTLTLTYGDIIADSVKHTAAALPGGMDSEEIITLSIPEEYRNAAYYVNANTKYKWKIT